MMCFPENPEVRQMWERVWPFFGPEDYGFMMENYGHGGVTSPGGEGMGNFTIYDWGNGAASEARNRVFDHVGDVYVDRFRNQAFGIDSVAVSMHDGSCTLRDLAGQLRNVRVVFEDDACRTIHLTDTATFTIEKG
jgi:hypothetical protein